MEAEQSGAPEHLVVGHLAKPHGTRGELFVWPLTERPEAVFGEGAEVLLGDEAGGVGAEPERLVVERSRPFKRGLLVKFEGLEDRNAVEPLVGRYLVLPVDELEPLEEGELFYHQLLGLEVVTVGGEVVGRVREVYETEPVHLLEVKRADGKLRLIPFAARLVRSVELEAGRLVIDPPPGLLEI